MNEKDLLKFVTDDQPYLKKNVLYSEINVGSIVQTFYKRPPVLYTLVRIVL